MQVTMGLRRAALVRGRDTAIIDCRVRRTWREEQNRVAAIAGYECPKTVSIHTEALPKSGAGKILKRQLRSKYWVGLERQIH
jgi:acyl-CoA synthetase (AMP-forming)/AMP-acid ligase II